jgi:hypothetical protein
MLAQSEGVLMVGGPGREPQEIEIQEDGGWIVSSYVVDPITRMAAVSVNRRNSEAGIWLVDAGTQEATEIYWDPYGVEPRIAGWSPDRQWILYWQFPLGFGESLAADGVPLYAISVEGGEPVQVLDKMLPNRDFMTWCGDTLVAASGGNRFVTIGKRLVAATAPDWQATDLMSQPDRSFSWPSCSPDGSQVAATSTPDEREDPLGSLPRTIDILPLEGSEAGVSLGLSPAEFPVWSQKHDPREQVFLHVRRESGGKRASLYLEEKIADLGAPIGYYGYYRYSDIFDWYQP